MDKLSVKSALQLLDNMSYDDNKQLEDIILKKREKKLFHISRHKNKYRIQGLPKKYHVLANDKIDAIDKFIRSDKVSNILISGYVLEDYKNIDLLHVIHIFDEGYKPFMRCYLY
jgi:hypothetical protein